MGKNIFLSYATQDGVFKDHFTHPKVFQIGSGVKIWDYKDYSNFGDISSFLEKTIAQSAALIAFISDYYIKSEFSNLEFWNGVSGSVTRHLVFVPVLMDAAGQTWWQEQKTRGTLRELTPKGGTYAFVDFTDGKGSPVKIFDNGEFNAAPSGRITDLAIRIKDELESLEEEPIVSPETLINGGVGGLESGSPRPPQPLSETQSIVVLGHRSLPMPKEVQDNTDDLVRALRGRRTEPTIWKDRWAFPNYAPAPEQASKALLKDHVFVQPLAPLEAGSVASNPERPREWLAKLVGKEPSKLPCQIVLWLPAQLSDPEFEEKAQAENPSQATPSLIRFSHAAPEVLASELAPAPTEDRTEMPVIMLEEFTFDPDLRQALHEGFEAVVSREIKPPPETWAFDASEKSKNLERQIQLIRGNRAIIAIHDLNSRRSKDDQEARKFMEEKFEASERRVRDAEAKCGRQALTLFWSTILYEHVEDLPWVQYPAKRFKQWHMLPFVKRAPNDDVVPEPSAAEILPEPSAAEIFRSYLRKWVRTSGVPA